MRIAVSIPETAEMLGISVAHAYNMAKSGDLATIKIGKRVLVPLQLLNQKMNTAERKEN